MRRLETTGSCVTGCLGGEPHVLSILGRGKVKSRMDVVQPLRATTWPMDVVQPLHATTGTRAYVGQSQFAG